MAKTRIEPSDAVTVEHWEEKVFRESFKNSYFLSRFAGPKLENGFKNNSTLMDSVVTLKRQLESSQGDKITFTFLPKLTGTGVTGTQKLEGNEERLINSTDDLTLQLYRHGVRDRGALDRKRPVFNMDKESEYFLQSWMSEKIDELCFEALRSSPSRFFYLDSSGVPQTTTTEATAKSALNASGSTLDDFKIFAFLKAFAKNGGADASGNRLQNPIKPIKHKGQDYYVLLVSEDVAYDLRTSSAYEQANREARERSSENPLFTGAEMIFNGVVVHTHENVPLATDGGGASVPWSHCHFLGQGALAFAFGQRPKVSKQNFDYDNEHGYGISMIAKAKKCQFSLTEGGTAYDHGSFSVYLARTKVNDA